MSEQMDSLMRSYGVTTRRALLRAIRDEYTVETGERFTLRDADLMLDGMLEAEYQKLASGGGDRDDDNHGLRELRTRSWSA